MVCEKTDGAASAPIVTMIDQTLHYKTKSTCSMVQYGTMHGTGPLSTSLLSLSCEMIRLVSYVCKTLYMPMMITIQ